MTPANAPENLDYFARFYSSVKSCSVVGKLMPKYKAGRLLFQGFLPGVPWTTKQKSRFVEGFLMGVPLFICAEEGFRGEWTVVRGCNQAQALVTFIDGEFALTGLKSLPEINGKTFSELPYRVQNYFEKPVYVWSVSYSASDDLKLRFMYGDWTYRP